MSGDFSFTAQNYPDTGKAPPRESSGKIEKGLGWLLIVSGIVICAELIWLFAVSPCLPFASVDVRGFAGFDSHDVLRYAGITEKASFFTLNAQQVKRRLAEHYLVEEAAVTKKFPDRLTIALKQRQAIAQSFADVNGRQMPLYMDRFGVVFQLGGQAEGNRNLPIISGLAFENPVPGMRLPVSFAPLLESVNRIGANYPELMSAISEIRINRKAWEDFDITLYTIHSAIRVRMEKYLTDDNLRYMLLMLDAFENHFPKPEEIDFRSGIGSYVIKEASLG
jgi:cell division protein FtsQ